MKRLLILTSLIIIGCTGLSRMGQAQPMSGWLDPNLTFGQRDDVISGVLPNTIISGGNIPCTMKSFTTRPAIVAVQTAQTNTACAVAASFGWVAPGGYTDIFKTDAKLFSDNGGSANFYTVPGTMSGVVLENTAQGWRLHYFANGLLAVRKDFNLQTHELNVYLPASPTWSLQDASGRPLYVRPESVTFSNNGKWMAVDSPFVATLLVNLESGKVIPFTAPYSYHLGFSVTPHLAVSDDGQTVVRSSDSGEFKIINTASCATVPTVITGPVSCGSILADQIIRPKVSSYRRVYQPRFLNDRRLSLYVSANPTGVSNLAKYQLAIPGETIESQDYLALGDSFSSGEGAYDYFPETDTPENKCHLSRQSYPYLVGRQLVLTGYNSVACSGAKVSDILNDAQKPRLPSNNLLGKWLPGYQPQLAYVREHNPGIVTIGIVGNDVGLITKLRACLSAGDCYPNYEDRVEIIQEINRQFPKLVDTYSQIKQSAKSGARIYVVGYPQVAAENGSCGLNVRLSNEEVKLVNRLIDYLNLVISRAAKRSGVSYVDMTNALAGRRLCESNQPLAFNGITLGNDAPFSFGPIGSESFHPNQLGHQLFKQKILSQTSNLTQAMPAVNSNANVPSEAEAGELLQARKTSRPINQTINDETMTSDNFKPGQAINLTVGSAPHFFRPASDFRVEIHSEPQVISSGETDSQGAIKMTAKLPTDIEAGFHTIHIFATDIAGNSVDIYKGIAVSSDAASASSAASSPAAVVDSQITDHQTDYKVDEKTGTLPATTKSSTSGMAAVANRSLSRPAPRIIFSLVALVGLILIFILTRREL